MEPSTCCVGRDECFLSSSASLLMADTQAEKMALVAWRTGTWRLQIVKRSDAVGFEVLPKRWIVERTFAWISRNRRLARDFERYATTVAAFVRLAMIRIMLRRLAATASSSLTVWPPTAATAFFRRREFKTRCVSVNCPSPGFVRIHSIGRSPVRLKPRPPGRMLVSVVRQHPPALSQRHRLLACSSPAD